MPPILTAVSSSTKQLFLLIRCISFSSNAHVQITSQGLRFSVEEARVVQGIAFLEKSLFTTYQYEPPSLPSSAAPEEDQDAAPPASFQISLPALLETLQIFGFNDARDPYSSRDGGFGGGVESFGAANAAFSNHVLGMNSVCKLSYDAPGEPLCITMEEAGVVTTCELATYEPETLDAYEDIPFDRDRLQAKVIMHPSHLYDAIQELSSTSPERLTISASSSSPYFVLAAVGPLGSANVEFAKDPQLLETFQVNGTSTNAYKFALIKAAGRAMSMAAKVSLRSDSQGVLSLQFMIENESGGGVSFVDFRFVPYLDEDEDGSGPEENK